MDPYKTLGLRKNAAPDSIRKKYRALAAKHHPDRNPGDAKAPERFRAIQAAYELLIDAERRARYDATGDTSSRIEQHQYREVMEILSVALGEVVQQIVKQGGKANAEDLITHVGTGIRHGLKAHEAELAELIRVQDFMAGAQSRIKVAEGEENLVAGAVRTHIAQIDAEIVKRRERIDKIKRALEYLKKYSYEFERMMRGGFGATSGTSGRIWLTTSTA